MQNWLKHHLFFWGLSVFAINWVVFMCGCHPLTSEQEEQRLTQKLRIIFVELKAGNSEIQLQGLTDRLTRQEVDELKNAGVKGVLFIRSDEERGRLQDKGARVVIVMNEQIHTSIELRQPDGTNAIYLQKGDFFELIPKNTPTLAATIRLSPGYYASDTAHPEVLTVCTMYEITREDGGGYRGTAFSWEK